MTDEVKIEFDEGPNEVRVCMNCGAKIYMFPEDVGIVVTCPECGLDFQTGDWNKASTEKSDEGDSEEADFDRGPIDKCILGLQLQLLSNLGMLAFALGLLNLAPESDSLVWMGVGFLCCRLLGLLGYLGCGTFQNDETDSNQFNFAFSLELIGILLIGMSFALHAGKLKTEGGEKFIESVRTFWILAGLLMLGGYFAYLFALSWLADHLKRPHLAGQLLGYMAVNIFIVLVLLLLSVSDSEPAMTRKPWPPPEPNMVWPIIQMVVAVLIQVWFLLILAGLINAAQKYRRAMSTGSRHE